MGAGLVGREVRWTSIPCVKGRGSGAAEVGGKRGGGRDRGGREEKRHLEQKDDGGHREAHQSCGQVHHHHQAGKHQLLGKQASGVPCSMPWEKSCTLTPAT